MFLHTTFLYIFINTIGHSESRHYEGVASIFSSQLYNRIGILNDIGNINVNSGYKLSNALIVSFDNKELISAFADNRKVISDATFILSCNVFQNYSDYIWSTDLEINVEFIDNGHDRQNNDTASVKPGYKCDLDSFGGSGPVWIRDALSWNITESCPDKDSQIQLDFLPVLRRWSWCNQLFISDEEPDVVGPDYALEITVSRLLNDSWINMTSRDHVTSMGSAIIDITIADACPEPESAGCNDRTCIRQTERCNFQTDCAMGEDEMKCGLLCDFDPLCDWTSSGFVVTSTEHKNNPNMPHSETHTGRKLANTDATAKYLPELLKPAVPFDINSTSGAECKPKIGRYALFTSKSMTSFSAQLTSPWYRSSSPRCRIQYLVNIFGVYVGHMSVKLRTGNITHEITRLFEEHGNKWMQQTITIGRITSPFQITFEAQKGYGYSYIALDDVTMQNCSLDDAFLIGLQPQPTCSDTEFRCNTSVCISHDRVCDLHNDCLFGDDEQPGCDTLPAYSRCTFESGDVCGWHNLNGDVFDWIMHKGSTRTKETGPTYDHTLKTASGHYMYIEASNRVMGDIAVLSSGLLPPPDPRTTAHTSSYFGTCQLRFFYHSYGPHTGTLEVRLRNFCEPDAQVLHLGSFSRVNVDQWQRMVVPLVNISTWYTVELHVTTVPRHMGDIAIDDITFTAECFGGGMLTNWSHGKISSKYVHVNQSVDREAICIMSLTEVNTSDIGSTPALVLLDVVDAHSNVGMVVAISLALVLLGISLAAFIICVRRRHKKVPGKDTQEMADFIVHFQAHMSNSEYNPTYNIFTAGNGIEELREIPRGSIQLIRPLGHGAFGDVYLGHVADHPSSNGMLHVAIKTLQGQTDDHAQEEFIMEAIIMSKFNHPNIVKFYGVCFESNPKFIILELLEGGDLKNFLKKSRPKPNYPSLLSMKDLFGLAVDIAKGCRYLEECHFIHRDIAARNCLLTTTQPERMAKIADFGMSREMLKEYYRKSGKAMLPIKWMPPEAFLDGTFTSKTDVWSFGVLLWEIFTLGLAPYPGLSNHEVMEYVTGGHRMQAPVNCPKELYNLMEWCWAAAPTGRPTFSEIIDKLQQFQQNPLLLSIELPIYYNASDDGLNKCGYTGSDNSVHHRALNGQQCPQVPYYIEPICTPPPDEPNCHLLDESDGSEPLIPIANGECTSPKSTSGHAYQGRVEDIKKELTRSVSESQPDVAANPQVALLRGAPSSASASALTHICMSTRKPHVFTSRHASSPSLNINQPPDQHHALLSQTRSLLPWLPRNADVDPLIATNRPGADNGYAGANSEQQNSSDGGRTTRPNKYVVLPSNQYRQSEEHI